VQVLPSTACAYGDGSANQLVMGYHSVNTSKKVVGNVPYRGRLDNLRPFPLRAAQTADVFVPLRLMNPCAYITGPVLCNRPVQERCIFRNARAIGGRYVDSASQTHCLNDDRLMLGGLGSPTNR